MQVGPATQDLLGSAPGKRSGSVQGTLLTRLRSHLQLLVTTAGGFFILPYNPLQRMVYTIIGVRGMQYLAENKIKLSFFIDNKTDREGLKTGHTFLFERAYW
jgi:hypothetical protein